MSAESSDAKAADEASDVRNSLAEVDATPLGFSTGGGSRPCFSMCTNKSPRFHADKAVDRAATLLRLLYIEDLRDCQTLVNEILVFSQSYTANPQTDAKLGQVGR